MESHAEIPCHHPAWPRYCGVCGKLSDGFNIVIPSNECPLHVERPKDGGGRWAWGMNGAACISCKTITLEKIDESISPSPKTIERVILREPWFAGMKILWVERKPEIAPVAL